MIAIACRGEVLDIALDHAVIEAAGVGYKVMATPSTLATLRRGDEARLITAMIVREDSMTLYGFADADARDLFLHAARGLRDRARASRWRAGHVRRPTLRQAIGDGDVTALTRMPGSARRRRALVLDLRDKVGRGRAASGCAVAPPATAVRGPVVEALVGLGFAVKQAEEATDKVLADDPAATSRARCAPRCRCWARSDGPLRRRTSPRTTTDREVSAGADRRRGRHRRQPAAAVAGRVHRSAPGARAAAAGARGRQEPRRHPRSHPAVRSARAWARRRWR